MATSSLEISVYMWCLPMLTFLLVTHTLQIYTHSSWSAFTQV